MDESGLKYFVYVSIISADNSEYSEDVKLEIIRRFGEYNSTDREWEDYNWEYILIPIGDPEKIERLIKLIK